jgi:uncharacterized protein YkwD
MKVSLLRARRALLALLAALGLVVASVAPAAADTVPSSTTASSIGYNLFLMLNQERAANHLPGLTSNPYLRASAHGHNLKMAYYNTLSHRLTGELSLGARILANRYDWAACGENIAYNTNWTWSGAQYVQNLMYNEVAPDNGHRLNILSKTFHNVGIDVYMDAAHHKMWITMDFGVWI